MRGLFYYQGKKFSILETGILQENPGSMKWDKLYIGFIKF